MSIATFKFISSASGRGGPRPVLRPGGRCLGARSGPDPDARRLSGPAGRTLVRPRVSPRGEDAQLGWLPGTFSHQSVSADHPRALDVRGMFAHDDQGNAFGVTGRGYSDGPIGAGRPGIRWPPWRVRCCLWAARRALASRSWSTCSPAGCPEAPSARPSATPMRWRTKGPRATSSSPSTRRPSADSGRFAIGSRRSKRRRAGVHAGRR